jgi:hypothetical protein
MPIDRRAFVTGGALIGSAMVGNAATPYARLYNLARARVVVS